jgi:hypothetical protein
VKPVALVVDAIKDCSKQGDIVLDPFCGSGTIIIAAERTSRKARALEIDPAYVDVAIRRWQQLTGKSATLSTGDRRAVHHTPTSQPHGQEFYIPSRPVRRRDYHSSGNGRRRGSSPICSNRRSDRYVSKGQSSTTSFSQYRTRCISTPKCFSRRNYAELQYRVPIDDNAQYMDESERAAHGLFGSATFAR